MKEQVERLWSAIKHGDDDHKAWLKEALEAFFAGEPIPESRGKGSKEARIAELEAQVAALQTNTDEDALITDEMREAGKAAWIRCIDNVPNDPNPDAFGEVYKAMRDKALASRPVGEKS